MAKSRLRRGKSVSHAAAMVLTLFLASGFAGNFASAEGGGPEGLPSAESAAPSPRANQPEGTTNAPVAEAARGAPEAAKPADAPSPETKDTRAEGQTSGTMPSDKAKDAAKEAGQAAAVTGQKDGGTDSKPAEGKEAKAAPKPRDLMPKPENGGTLAVRASVVNAVYSISWLGAHIGDFTIRSSITNRQYSLQANADLSVFFGTVTWQGVTSSHGLMTANGPVPQDYSFRYATNDRHEAIQMHFQQRMVQDIIINPPAHPGGRNVPITAAHLQNVVDPLSAIVLLSQARLQRQSSEACNKRIPIFDGRVRYDLVLSPKGTRSIGRTGKLHGTAFVCSVYYVPIAGHKAGKRGENDYATGNTGIEVWLVPLPEAGLLVPYYVHVPTPAGTASMVTAKFEVDTPAGRHALAD